MRELKLEETSLVCGGDGQKMNYGDGDGRDTASSTVPNSSPAAFWDGTKMNYGDGD